MNHQRGLDRSQTLLFPERLDDCIAPENPVRFLDAFVGWLDIHHALDLPHPLSAPTGALETKNRRPELWHRR